MVKNVWHIENSMHGSSQSQLFVGFSIVHAIQKIAESHMCMYKQLACSTRVLSLALMLGTPYGNAWFLRG